MLYRNTKTGVVVNVNSVIHGDWEQLKDTAPISVNTEEKETTEPKKVIKKRKK